MLNINQYANLKYLNTIDKIFKDNPDFQRMPTIQSHQDMMVYKMISYYNTLFNDFNYAELNEMQVSSKNDAQNWLLPVKSFNNSTSGTTGKKFEYKIWHDCYHYIETINHYQQILHEFGFYKEITTLKVSSNKNENKIGFVDIQFKDCVFFYKKIKPKRSNHRLSHGSQNANCHHFLYDNDDIDMFCDYLSGFLKNNPIDVFLSPASFFSILLRHSNRICKLYSNTAESIIIKDAYNAKKSGVIDDYCDHMRSWDGGATFFTCKFGTYHLLDYLTYNEDIDGKLICTDFLNLGFPFFRYWNGDECMIGDKWNQCECGRYFRDFKFYGRPSFVWGSTPSIDILDIILNIPSFTQAKCFDDHVEITSVDRINDSLRRVINNQLKSVVFTNNDFTFSGSSGKIERVLDLRKIK